jgi:hypothetical protein
LFLFGKGLWRGKRGHKVWEAPRRTDFTLYFTLLIDDFYERLPFVIVPPVNQAKTIRGSFEVLESSHFLGARPSVGFDLYQNNRFRSYANDVPNS